MESFEKTESCPICQFRGDDISLGIHLLSHSKASLVNTLLQLQSKPLPKNSQEPNDPAENDTTADIITTTITTTPTTASSSNNNNQQIEDIVVPVQQHHVETALQPYPYSNVEVIVVASSNNHMLTSSEMNKSFINTSSVQTLSEQRGGFHDSTSSQNLVDCCRKDDEDDDCINQHQVLAKEANYFKGDEDGVSPTEKTFTVLQPSIICYRSPENFVLEDDISSSSESVDSAHIVNEPRTTTTDQTKSIMTAIQRQEWILPNGRESPVYLSANEFHSSGPTTSSKTLSGQHERNNLKSSIFRAKSEVESEGSNLDVDLMTDEEMPPKGEISEFEESNPSFDSEDSDCEDMRTSVLDSSTLNGGVGQVSYSYVETVGDLTSKSSQQETALPHPLVAVLPSEEDTASTAEKFICFDECQNHKSPKRFSSLFEMIQHKSGNHKKDNQGTEFPEILSNRMELADEITPRDGLGVESSGVEVDGKSTQISVPPSLQCKNYYCLYCEFTSRSRLLLTTHMKADHPDKSLKPEIFECSTCGKIFKNRSSLRKHLVIHRQKPFVCSTCSKGFPSRFKLMEHTRVHTGHYPFKCEQCEKCYRTPSLLSTHKKQAHPTSTTVPIKKVELMCGICHRILHSKRNLESHLQLHKQKPQKCIHCRETFPRQSVLVRHIRASHDPSYASVKTKECSICGKLMHPNSLKSHMLIHKQEKPHQCSVCHKYFRTPGNLSNHAWSHTSLERPFKCRLCPKSYIFLKNLQNHTIVHKRKTLHFVCNECGVKFTSKSNLKRHVEEHSGEKNFKCNICGKTFSRRYYLVEHLRIHNGSRPFTCTICGKASSTKSNHVAHVKIHDARESSSLEH